LFCALDPSFPEVTLEGIPKGEVKIRATLRQLINLPNSDLLYVLHVVTSERFLKAAREDYQATQKARYKDARKIPEYKANDFLKYVGKYEMLFRKRICYR
jgi:hypothetical protein